MAERRSGCTAIHRSFHADVSGLTRDMRLRADEESSQTRKTMKLDRISESYVKLFQGVTTRSFCTPRRERRHNAPLPKSLSFSVVYSPQRVAQSIHSPRNAETHLACSAANTRRYMIRHTRMYVKGERSPASPPSAPAATVSSSFHVQAIIVSVKPTATATTTRLCGSALPPPIPKLIVIAPKTRLAKRLWAPGRRLDFGQRDHCD